MKDINYNSIILLLKYDLKLKINRKMEIIILAILFMIIFYSLGNVGYIFNFVKEKVNVQDNIYGYMWFFSILFINLILIGYTIGYYHYVKKNSFGPIGTKGYPGQVGDETDCLICDNQS
tara:strand:+ start:965 stop:1321 length:357 start_codon:yes stop_codon:yes gene_type:complete